MKKVTDEILEYAKKSYLDGNSLRKTTVFIFKKYNIKIGKETLRQDLKKVIKLRTNKEHLAIKRGFSLDNNKIIDIYLIDKLSLKSIAKKFKVSPSGIKWILTKKGVNLRTKRESILLTRGKYTKINFYGDDIEKAYLNGITLGDAHSRKVSSFTIEVNTSSTNKNLIDIFYDIYKPYSEGVIVSKDKTKGFRFCAYLNNSFNFLLEIKKNSKLVNDLEMEPFLSFLAGFFDAEGCIVKRKRGKKFECIIKIGNTDIELLKIIKNKLEILNLNPKIYLYSKKGKYHDYYNRRIINRKPYYMLVVNRKKDMLQLLNKLDLKHKDKLLRKDWALNLLNPYPLTQARGTNRAILLHNPKL